MTLKEISDLIVFRRVDDARSDLEARGYSLNIVFEKQFRPLHVPHENVNRVNVVTSNNRVIYVAGIG